MKLSIFEAMSKAEAQKYLDEFLGFGKHRGMEILEEIIHSTVDLDFSIGSLSMVFKALIPTLKTVPREPDQSVPEFIRNTEEYKKGLFDFDARSNSIVLATAYYLGETFVRNFPDLKWATGNTDYFQGNTPVVTGFKFKKELSPILIAENIFSGVVSGISEESSIKTAITAWTNNVPD